MLNHVNPCQLPNERHAATEEPIRWRVLILPRYSRLRGTLQWQHVGHLGANKGSRDLACIGHFMQKFFAEINGFFTCNGHFMKQSLQNKSILLNTMRLLPMQLSFLCLIGHCWLACIAVETQQVFTSLIKISHY